MSVDAVRVSQSSSSWLVFVFLRRWGFLLRADEDFEVEGTGVGKSWAWRRRVEEDGRERREGVVGIEVEG